MTNRHRPQLNFYFVGKRCSQLNGFHPERFGKLMTNSGLNLGHEDTSAARKDHLTGPVVGGGMEELECILKDRWTLASSTGRGSGWSRRKSLSFNSFWICCQPEVSSQKSNLFEEAKILVPLSPQHVFWLNWSQPEPKLQASCTHQKSL